MLPLFPHNWGQIQLSMGEDQGTPWMSRQLIAGPLLMAEAALQKVPTAHQAISGFSILLKDTSTCSSVPPQGSRDSNQRPSDRPPRHELIDIT